jgi:hypothetical protein
MGPMQFAPYRPWSEERKAAARTREIARRALMAPPLTRNLPQALGPSDAETKSEVLPQSGAATAAVGEVRYPPNTSEAVVDPNWREEGIEYGCIRPDPAPRRTYVLLATNEYFTLKRRTTLSSISFDGRRYKFKEYMSFPAACYVIEVSDNRMTIGEADGAFGDIVCAYADNAFGQ